VQGNLILPPIGVFPIMWATGTGSDLWKRIAARMVGGILTCLLLATLYLFRTATVHQQASAPSAVERLITMNAKGQGRCLDMMPQETRAMALRCKRGFTNAKIG
jgi:hypothetical protein